MIKNVIITGPTGSIGTALIDVLIQNGIEVYAICRPNSKRIKNIARSRYVHIIEMQLSELAEVKKELPDRCDTFFHFGWMGTFGNIRNDMFLQTENIQYTLDAVELAKECGCSTFIGAGSQAEYGRFEGKLNADTPTFPENGYGMAKLCAGHMSRIKCKEYGMRHIWTRILSVYGPFDGENTMIMSTIHKLLAGEKPSLTDGEQKWDYLYSKDAAGILYSLMKKGKDGKVYCLGRGEAVPLKEYVKEIRDVINERLELGFGEIPYGEKQVMFLCADTQDLEKDIGYQYRYEFSDGIKETIAWYRGRKSDEEN